MENSKFIKLLTPIFILGFFVAQINSAFAYDIETHAYLTSEIIKFYNQNFPNNKISDELMPYLIDGSRREDDIPRWMNHFYDPVYNRGLTDSVLGTWQKSKDWAQDSNNQNSLIYKVPATITSILTAIQQRAISVLATETDFTWQRAIKFYVQGEKEKGLFILGHILHLIEDASVPDHTRNDPHPGDSPYENYTSRFNLINPDKNLNSRLNNKTPIILSNLNFYFDELAKYSNNNFYSKDRIGKESGYDLPEIDTEGLLKKDGDYYYIGRYDEDNNLYYLAVYKNYRNSLLLETKSNLVLKIEDEDKVVSDYWSRLSTKAVQYGAGVINLFFQEVEKAKNNPNFVKQEEKSFFGQIINQVKNLTAQAVSSVGGFFTGIFGDNRDFQPVGQVSLQIKESEKGEAKNQGEAESLAEEIKPKTQKTGQQKPPLPSIEAVQNQSSYEFNEVQLRKIEQVHEELEQELTQQQQEPKQEPKQQQESKQQQPQTVKSQQSTLKQCSFNTSQSPSRQKVIINEVAWMGTVVSANDEWIELKNISSGEVNMSNWQLLDQSEQIKIIFDSGTKISANGFYLLERADDDSVPGIVADKIYSGALSNTNEGLRLFDGQCNLIDEVLANPNWPAGDNTSAAERKTAERNLNDFGWHTSSIVNGTPKAANSSGYVAIYSRSSGISTTNNPQQTTNNQQQASAEIKITEIMYDLPGSDSGREWVEIFNVGNSAVDLSGWKFYENETNHSLNLVSGSAILGAGQYAIIADDSNKFLQDNPQYIGTLFDSSFSLSNTGESLAIKNGDAVISQVDYSSSWGANGDGASLQLINGEWHAAPPTPGGTNVISQNNQAPSAFFVFSPQNPKVNQEIIFNAASLTGPDNHIVLYQWDFGDNQNVTTTQNTVSHSYSAAGNYLVQLTVFDNKNASAVASSTINISSAPSTPPVPLANHIVISEILFDAEGSDEGKEFIELYNPTTATIDLTGWSLKYFRGNFTLANSLASFKTSSRLEDQTLISSQGFLLIGLNNYEATAYNNRSADIRRAANLPNGDEPITVVLYNNQNDEVDRVVYDKNSISAAGKSLERKAWQDNQCVSSQANGEFLGNGCDRDYDNDNGAMDLEIRNNPNPQNSQSLPEPRSSPTTPQNFNVTYSPSTLQLNFTWQASSDYSGSASTVIYQIVDTTTTSTILATTTSTIFTTTINEIGRDYNFSIQAFDRDGLGSALSTDKVWVPSFLSGLYFYQDPKALSADYLIEAYYDQYPFVPNLYYDPPNSNWKLLIFYLDNEAKKQSDIQSLPYQPNNLENVLAVKYKHCSGGSIIKENSLLLPDINDRCSTGGGAQNISFDFSELEDNHFIIRAASSTSELTLNSQNYLTVAFYSTYYVNVGPTPYFKLTAIDKTKYYFGNQPNRQLPQLTGSLNVDFDRQNSRLNIDWPKATDPDTLDSLLTYEIKFNESDSWTWLNSSATGTVIWVAPGDNLSISVRAKDDFENYSDPPLTTQWFYPETTFYISQTGTKNWSGEFGYKDGAGSQRMSLQSIVPTTDFQFDRVVLNIKHSVISDSANLRLSIYPDNGSGWPDFNNRLSSAVISNVSGLDGSKDSTFNFASPVSVSAHNKYWLVLDVESYPRAGDYYGYKRNEWRNAISSGNPYSQGESGQCQGQGTYYGDFSFSADNDWYMKIGLGQ